VYAGDTDAEDGAERFLDRDLMVESANLAVLRAGLAYAAIYTSLPIDLAADLREITRATRATGDHIYGQESFDTERAVPINGLDELETMVMWPKLFRRLVSFFAAGFADLTDLDGWLREDPIQRDDRLLLPNGELGNMHDLVVIQATAMRLSVNPEEVTILPRLQSGTTDFPRLYE
jgi:hypothetical protein